MKPWIHHEQPKIIFALLLALAVDQLQISQHTNHAYESSILQSIFFRIQFPDRNLTPSLG